MSNMKRRRNGKRLEVYNNKFYGARTPVFGARSGAIYSGNG